MFDVIQAQFYTKIMDGYDLIKDSEIHSLACIDTWQQNV